MSQLPCTLEGQRPLGVPAQTAPQEQRQKEPELPPASLRPLRLSPPAPLMHQLPFALLTLNLLNLKWKRPRAPAPEPPAGLEPPPTPEYQPALVPQSVFVPSAMK